MMLALVIAILVTAAAAPAIAARLGGRSGWLLAVVPAACFLLLLARIGDVAEAAMPATATAPAEVHAGGATGGHPAGPAAAPDPPVGTRVTGDRLAVPWIDAADVGFDVELAMRLDGLSLLMALLVTGIGALVMVYAGGYLAGDARQPRFMGVLLAFMASMLGLVLADDVLTLFVFWEGTSVTSYLLIGFDRHRAAARRAAMQALLVTGSGGLAMLAGLLMLASAAGTFSIAGIIEARAAIDASPLAGPAMALILVGCFAKSAQLPFHAWLPNAMEAPTPVSSFLHSATMVKAGVYLIARLNPVFAGGGGAWEAILVGVGGATAIMAAVLALRQSQLKRLLAYSTIASLSLIIVAIGIGTAASAAAGMTFLLAHALYKCCLFQTAGNLTHGTGEKDVARLGGLGRAMPMVAAGGLLGGLGMMGLPPFMGYLGKETIIAAGWTQGGATSFALAATLVAGAAFVLIGAATAVRPFLGRRLETAHAPHDAPPSLWLGPLVLGGLGLLLGAGVLLGDPAGHLLVGPAAGAVRGAAVPTHLSFWHGPAYVPMWLDVAVLLAGLALFWRRPLLQSLVARGDRVLGLGPDRGYDVLLAAIGGIAARVTRTLQDASLSAYLVVITAFAVVTVGWEAFRGVLEFPAVASRRDLTGFEPHEFVTALSIVLGCFVMVRSRSRLSAIGGLGLVGYGVALMFVLLGAPDLAITQFLIETLSVLLLVLVFWKLPSFRLASGPSTRLRDGIVSGAFGMLMAVAVLVASQSEVGSRTVQGYYGATSYEEAHGRNVVNVILVDFRGVDTMGEITVLTVAALGVLALIRLPGDARRRDAGGGLERPGVPAVPGEAAVAPPGTRPRWAAPPSGPAAEEPAP